MSTDHAQIESARARLRELGADASTMLVVDRLAEAVDGCRAEQARLVSALDHLGGVRARDELKSALRSRPDPTAPDTATIAALRRRYEANHSIRNRLDELDDQVAAALTDLDTLVIEVATSAGPVRVVQPGDVAPQLQRLVDDARALTEARREMEEW